MGTRNWIVAKLKYKCRFQLATDQMRSCVCVMRGGRRGREMKDQREQCGHILDRLMNGIQCIYIWLWLEISIRRHTFSAYTQTLHFEAILYRFSFQQLPFTHTTNSKFNFPLSSAVIPNGLPFFLSSTNSRHCLSTHSVVRCVCLCASYRLLSHITRFVHYLSHASSVWLLSARAWNNSGYYKTTINWFRLFFARCILIFLVMSSIFP